MTYTKATKEDYAKMGLKAVGKHHRVLADTSSWFDRLIGTTKYEWVLPEEAA